MPAHCGVNRLFSLGNGGKGVVVVSSGARLVPFLVLGSCASVLGGCCWVSCVNSGSCHSCGLVNIVLLADLVAVLVMFAPFPFLGSYVLYRLPAWGIIPLNTVQIRFHVFSLLNPM